MDQRDSLTHELLSAYLDGELSRDESAHVEKLLATDADCQATYAAMAQVRSDMRSLPQYQLGTQFTDRVVALTGSVATAAEVQRPAHSDYHGASSSWRVWGYVAVAAAAVLLLALLVRPAFQPSNENEHLALQQGGDAARPTPPASKSPLGSGPSPKINRDQTSGEQAGVAPAADTEPARPADAVSDRNAASTAATDPASTPPAKASPKSPTAPIAPPKTSVGATEPQPPTKASGGNPPSMAKTANAGNGPNDAAANLPSTDKLLLVMDVFAAKNRIANADFEQALVQGGMPFFASIDVQDSLQKALLASRFFKPAKKPAPTPRPQDSTAAKNQPALQLVYVVARGGQIDQLWQTLQNDRQHFSGIAMDLAFRPDALNMFRELRGAAQTALGHNSQITPESGLPTGAYRLVLPPTWRGAPIRVGQPKPTQPPAPAPGNMEAPLGPGQRLGENIVAEILFVVHFE